MSGINNPPLGVWTAWTPVASPTAGGITTQSGSGFFVKNGRTVIANFSVTITDNGDGSGEFRITLPVPGAASNCGSVGGREGVSTGLIFGGVVNSSFANLYKASDGSYPAASNRRFDGCMTYQAA